MHVKIKAGSEIHSFPAVDLVIVEDDAGNPIAIASKTMSNMCVVSSVDSGEQNFNQALQAAGIDKSVTFVNIPDKLKNPAELRRIF